jgi:hypothetical protein
VYFWIVPAKVEGTWKLSGGKGGTLELKQKYQQVTGTATIDGKRSEIKDGKLNGAELAFTLAGTDGNATKHTATVDGDTMKGKTGEGKGAEFTAKREGGGAAKKDGEKKDGTTNEGGK